MRYKLGAVVLGLALTVTTGLGPAWADEDEGDRDSRCKDGRCCVGFVNVCDNEFPVPLPGQEPNAADVPPLCPPVGVPPAVPHCDPKPASLFPPTPDKIVEGVQVMFEAGIKLGTTIAQLVTDYVLTVFRFVVNG